MRKLIIIACFAMAATLTLGACQKEQAAPAAVAVVKPASPDDSAGWKAYLTDIVTHNLQGMTASRPYVYFIPGGDDEATMQRQFDNVHNVVLATVLPGNLMAFGGPDSSRTANLIAGAFADAEPDSFKGVIVLFIGDEADRQRVADALAPSAAEFRFVQM